jgi:hypothetical protein
MTMTREEFVAAVNWQLVAADMRETRAELEVRISQVDAEIRANVRERDAGTQSELARYQQNIDLLDWFIEQIDDAD